MSFALPSLDDLDDAGEDDSRLTWLEPEPEHASQSPAQAVRNRLTAGFPCLEASPSLQVHLIAREGKKGFELRAQNFGPSPNGPASPMAGYPMVGGAPAAIRLLAVRENKQRYRLFDASQDQHMQLSSKSLNAAHEQYLGKLEAQAKMNGVEYELSRCLPKVGKSKVGDKKNLLWAKLKAGDKQHSRRLKMRIPNKAVLLRNKTFLTPEGTCTMKTHLARFEPDPKASIKNFVLGWELRPGVVNMQEDTNIVEFAKVSDNSFQINIAADADVSPVQAFGIALIALVGKDAAIGTI